MTKEEILDKHYQPGMHWKVVNRAKVLQAIDECTAPLEEEIERLKWLIREGFILLQQEWNKPPGRIKTDWEQFCKDNKL